MLCLRWIKLIHLHRWKSRKGKILEAKEGNRRQKGGWEGMRDEGRLYVES